MTKRLVERAMDAEPRDHLGYERGEAPPGGTGNARGEAPPGGTGNARNGLSEKTVHTDQGSVRIVYTTNTIAAALPEIASYQTSDVHLVVCSHHGDGLLPTRGPWA